MQGHRESTYNKPKPGFVRINDKEYFCGIRMLTEQEASRNHGFPFDEAELRSIIAAKIPNPTKNQKNTKVLAQLILDNQRANPIGSSAKTEQVNILTPEQLKKQGYSHKQKGPDNPQQTGFHRGDIIAYVENLQKSHPDKKIGILNPANSQFVGGYPFLGATALEEIYFYSSNLVFAYARHAWDDGFSYQVKNYSAVPAYKHGMESGTAWSTENVAFLQKPDARSETGYSKLEKPVNVTIVASVAPQYANIQQARALAKTDETRIRNEIRAQLTAFVKSGTQIPVLAAFGCGVFSNAPELMAKYYWEALYKEGYADFFERVDFAIPQKGEVGVYTIFKDTFDKLNKSDQHIKVQELDVAPQPPKQAPSANESKLKLIVEKLQSNLDKYRAIVDAKVSSLQTQIESYKNRPMLTTEETEDLNNLNTTFRTFKDIQLVNYQFKQTLIPNPNEQNPYEASVKNYYKLHTNKGTIIKKDAEHGGAFINLVNKILGPVKFQWLKDQFSFLKSDGENLHDKSEKILRDVDSGFKL